MDSHCPYLLDLYQISDHLDCLRLPSFRLPIFYPQFLSALLITLFIFGLCRQVGFALPLSTRLVPNLRPPHLPATTKFPTTDISLASICSAYTTISTSFRTAELLAISIHYKYAMFATLADELNSRSLYLLYNLNFCDHPVCYCRVFRFNSSDYVAICSISSIIAISSRPHRLLPPFTRLPAKFPPFPSTSLVPKFRPPCWLRPTVRDY